MNIDELYEECLQNWNDFFKNNHDYFSYKSKINITPWYYYNISKLYTTIGKIDGYKMSQLLDKYLKGEWFYDFHSKGVFNNNLQLYEFVFYNIDNEEKIVFNGYFDFTKEIDIDWCKCILIPSNNVILKDILSKKSSIDKLFVMARIILNEAKDLLKINRNIISTTR